MSSTCSIQKHFPSILLSQQLNNNNNTKHSQKKRFFSLNGKRTSPWCNAALHWTTLLQRRLKDKIGFVNISNAASPTSPVQSLRMCYCSMEPSRLTLDTWCTIPKENEDILSKVPGGERVQWMQRLQTLASSMSIACNSFPHCAYDIDMYWSLYHIVCNVPTCCDNVGRSNILCDAIVDDTLGKRLLALNGRLL
jgi:hypothetical protein